MLKTIIVPTKIAIIWVKPLARLPGFEDTVPIKSIVILGTIIVFRFNHAYDRPLAIWLVRSLRAPHERGWDQNVQLFVNPMGVGE